MAQRERLHQEIQPASPHAHLHRRVLPMRTATGPQPGLLLRIWTEVSLSVLLAFLGITLLFDGAAFELVVAALLGVMAIEAALRRRLRYFLLGVAIVTALIIAVVIIVTEWRVGLGIAALIASVALALANLRAAIARR